MAEREVTVAIRDGSQVVLRPVQPDDKQELVDGFEHWSPESRYKRFLGPMNELGERDIKYLTEEGVSRFTATCLASNDEVLDLLRELGPTRVTNVGDGLLEAEIELPASADTEGPLRRLIRRVAAGELAVRVRP
jgi:hypothetical protein